MHITKNHPGCLHYDDGDVRGVTTIFVKASTIYARKKFKRVSYFFPNCGIDDGQLIHSRGKRFIIQMNHAVMDLAGEYICVKLYKLLKHEENRIIYWQCCKYEEVKVARFLL